MELERRIGALIASGAPRVLVALDGKCATGKTTLARALAEKYGVPVARIALAALLADPLDGCAIIAASSLPQLDDSLAADGLMLSPEEIRWLYDDFSADSACK